MTPESLFSLEEWVLIYDAVLTKQQMHQLQRKEATEHDQKLDDTYADILAVIRSETNKLL